MNAIPVIPPLPVPWYRRIYRTIADHLTKVLGIIGAAFMALISIDPTPVQAAAQLYLSAKYVKIIGMVLFGLVIARGWYTGMKAKKA